MAPPAHRGGRTREPVIAFFRARRRRCGMHAQGPMSATMIRDYASFQSVLRRAEADTDAAEVHGFVCGLACVPTPPAEDDWLRALLGEEMPESVSQGECRDALLACRAEVAAQLASTTMTFAPLLPADEEPLGMRSSALAAWCSGFLYALGLGGISDPAELTGESREVLGDLVEFTHMDADPGDGEEEESAYAELVEYVRVGVLLVHDDMVARRGDVPDGATVH